MFLCVESWFATLTNLLLIFFFFLVWLSSSWWKYAHTHTHLFTLATLNDLNVWSNDLLGWFLMTTVHCQTPFFLLPFSSVELRQNQNEKEDHDDDDHDKDYSNDSLLENVLTNGTKRWWSTLATVWFAFCLSFDDQLNWSVRRAIFRLSSPSTKSFELVESRKKAFRSNWGEDGVSCLFVVRFETKFCTSRNYNLINSLPHSLSLTSSSMFFVFKSNFSDFYELD